MEHYKNLFLKQSYEDSWTKYCDSLFTKSDFYWDYIVLTASDEIQAQTYRAQIDSRLQNRQLPAITKYLVIADPDGGRIGSGGSTLNVIKCISELEKINDFRNLKILIIHSGGDSKRVPQYSVCGKIFSPVPRKLPDGRRSSIFDEFIISLCDIPARISAGIFVVSGDVLLLFNSLQVDFCTKGAAAITFKKDAGTGSRHGVFVEDSDGNVGKTLQKRSLAELIESGAVDADGNVNIDTGAIALDYNVVNDLLGLVRDDEGCRRFINSNVRLNFYSDFLIPMTSSADCDEYLSENAENRFSAELSECRKILWDTLNKYRIKLLKLSPASFIHLGTTGEILNLLNNEIQNYSMLDWSRNINTNSVCDSFSASNSFISEGAIVGEGSYIEDSLIGENCIIGKNCVISCMNIDNVSVPDGTVVHGLKLKDGRFTVRVYSIDDNPKEKRFFGKDIPCSLWDYRVYPVCGTAQEACIKFFENTESEEYTSFCESFENADGLDIIRWQSKILNKVNADKFIDFIKDKADISLVKEYYGGKISDGLIPFVLENYEDYDYSIRMRIYYYLSELCEEPDGSLYRKKCFESIREMVLEGAVNNIQARMTLPTKDSSRCFLPVRVNWGGGWSDTPPYCNEHGGTVLNAAVRLEGELPIRAYAEKIREEKIVFSCKDNGAYEEFTSVKELLDLSNPFDWFAIQKAALIILGIIPRDPDAELSEILKKTGGFSVTTYVRNIPRGSGLGTSSILAAACVKTLCDFFNINMTDNETVSAVIAMEQIMSTGGGWQDQVGGLCSGIKLISSDSGFSQNVDIKYIELSEKTRNELNERFCLIYSGQRRLARNILRKVVGRYLGNVPESIDAFNMIQKIAAEMRDALAAEDVDRFAELMNLHWKYSRQLDSGCSNTCMDQIFNVCEDMIDGKMVCGAGGGGFLQVMLKKGITKKMLNERIHEVFGDIGVRVWDSSFYW